MFAGENFRKIPWGFTEKRVERRSRALRSFVRSSGEPCTRHSRLIDPAYRAVVVDEFFGAEFHGDLKSRGVAPTPPAAIDPRVDEKVSVGLKPA